MNVKPIIFDAILQGFEATESGALEYAACMCWGEVEAEPQSIGYANHIDTINGVGVYYDYAADYYFFTDETD